ncbi:hypothetical protein [Macrococcus animalis]|uniref:hypothetical protein n=1 Tax=Macrococcus animalis TaxID=3395467 RepID=UPI0039BE6DAA
MIKEFQQSFFQISFLGLIWITLIASITNIETEINFYYFWRLILISILIGITFGVIYPYLWKYATTNSITNVFICSTDNTAIIMLSVYLFSEHLFKYLFSYLYIILIFNIILHLIIFKIYSDYLNRKYILEINTFKAGN